MTKVLNLIAQGDAPCFQQQVAGLERLGVDCTNIPVPSTEKSGNRGLRHYAKLQIDTLVSLRESYDLIHANYGLTAPAALTQHRLPVVLSLWGSDLMGEYGWLSRWCAKYCDAVIVMSEEMEAELDVPCHVIPHGVDMELFEPMDQRDAQAQVGWDQDVRHVLFPYSPERAVKDYPRAKRVVEEVTKQFSEPVDLKYITGIDHDQIPVYMNAADVLLMTSKREGSPNVVKEALACNLPVVSTDVGDVRDRLGGVSPSAVGTSDTELIDEVLSSLEYDGDSNGRKSVEHLSRMQMCERIHDVYDQVLNDDLKTGNEKQIHKSIQMTTNR